MVVGRGDNAARYPIDARKYRAALQSDSIRGRRCGLAEIRHLVMTIGEWTLILPANSQVESQLMVHLPIVLQKNSVVQLLIFVTILIGVASSCRIA